MATYRSLNFNNGQSINLGSITKYWGLSGYNPIETIAPTGFNINRLRADLERRYNAHIPSAVASISSSSFDTLEEAQASISEAGRYLIDQYWLYGSFEHGGCFMWTIPDSGTCQFVQWYGLYYVTDLIQGNSYKTFCNSLNVPFRVHVNGDDTLPITDNILYFFNWSDTPADAETNHVMNSEKELKICDTRSIGHYTGSDVRVQDAPLPERWEQTQWYVSLDSNGLFLGAYLGNYTDDDYTNNTPHPWYRLEQNRVVPNLQFFTGIDVENGTLVDGYVPLSDSDNVTHTETEQNYDGGGDAGGSDGGGYAPQSDNGEDIDSGKLPSSNFLETGLNRIYLPTQAQMTAFNQYLFSDITQSTVDKLKKMWSNPLDYVENVAVCRVAGLTSAGTQNIRFGGIDSGVSCNYTNQAFHKMRYECSGLYEEYGTALDYSSYTKLKIYIPYCGIYDLNIDEFQAPEGQSNIILEYKIDIMSGMCVALLTASKTQHDSHYKNLNSVMYQFNGNIFLPLSVTATDWRNTYQSVLNIAGGMIAPSPSTAVGMASEVMGQKVNVQHSGSIGTNFGFMGRQLPYLIVEIPAKSEPKYDNDYNYKNNYGFPCNKQLPLSTFSGGNYVKVAENTLWSNNIHCSDDEANEIKQLLTGGIWI